MQLISEAVVASDDLLQPSRELVERFERDIRPLVAPAVRIGIAVSGGPDSLALLLLAAAARPGFVEAATVDHALRPDSQEEADAVAILCERIGVPHTTLEVEWTEKPVTAIQERARAVRYQLLGHWAAEREIRALCTGHQLDDQAETLLMRLARGAGVKGLAGMRTVKRLPGLRVALVRPLLRWRRKELEQVCADAGLTPLADPSNEDEQFERVRLRNALAEADWLDPQKVAVSAGHLADADEALHWSMLQAWDRLVVEGPGAISFAPQGLPPEIRRRLVRRAVLKLAREGQGADLRGREIDTLVGALATGKKVTLRGVLCSGGEEWRFAPAPNRARPAGNVR
jgi:tRNA(Ile)-lysidine synthase